MDDIRSHLELLIRARYALIVLETAEPDAADQLVREIAASLSLPFYSWTRSRGLRRGAGATDPAIEDTFEPARALLAAEREGAGCFVFRGLGPFLDDPLVASHAFDVAERFAVRRGVLVITGHDVRLPDALRPHATTLRLPPPTWEQYRALLERVTREWSARMSVVVELTPQERARLVANLAGLTLLEAEKILNRCIIEDGALRASDVERVAAAKRQAVQQDGLLEFCSVDQDMRSVAGLASLKAWLAKRRLAAVDPERALRFGLPFPKGVLLLGVPGCGKSLSAKAVASEWGLPLLRLDPATLYDKYVGDTEKNLRRALATAERVAPVVLWIDELEKAFASAGREDDGGVSTRIFGSFLTWLQERRGDVFVVATSNDVAKLPPEFIRKGRFDEIFFVDLPTRDARRGILAIHLAKRRQDAAALDLDALAAATDGFSGAEIEEAIVGSLYSAFAQEAPLSTSLVLEEIGRTRPLSRTMGERLGALRAWARERTVMAE